jgi:hypothetical protein
MNTSSHGLLAPAVSSICYYDNISLNETVAVTVETILASKGPGIDCWITSDGHVYVAQLHENIHQAGQSDLAHDRDYDEVGHNLYPI